METLAIGTPVIDHYDNRGFVSRVMEPQAKQFTLGTGKMVPVMKEYEVVFPNRTTVLGDGIIAPFVARAVQAKVPAISPDEVETRRQAAIAAEQEARQQIRAASDAATIARREFVADAATRIPSWAKAVIVGELIEDRSDPMSDYFGSTTKRTVILAFSQHTRDLFPEMRKAALNHAETAPLATAPEKAEHREKYSMGAGYYLKDGWRDSNGWKISKKSIRGADSIPSGEWSLTPPAAAEPAAEPAGPAAVSSGFSISQHVHTKKGFNMWIVSLADRVERAEYERLLNRAKAAGGWYSKAWGTSPAGFAFKDETAAQQFAGEAPAAAPAAQQDKPATTAPRASLATKFRDLADKMQGDINHAFADRLTNTPKRQREADSARIEGRRLERTQAALRALADHHDAGTVPHDLATVMTKAAVYDLARAHVDHSRGGYYDAGHDTGRPAVDSPAARALWSLLKPASAADQAAEQLRQKIQALQFANIPGYFPTPAAIVDRMISYADIPAGGCSVLEPSAGSGNILDRVKVAEPGCEFVIFERHWSLFEILRIKGYDCIGAADFMESDTSHKVARVIMNPPFENGQDIDHVMRAFLHLQPGGRLVAIVSPGPFFHSTRKAQDFRRFVDCYCTHKEELPAGTFKESGTGVASVLIVLNKPAAA